MLHLEERPYYGAAPNYKNANSQIRKGTFLSSFSYLLRASLYLKVTLISYPRHYYHTSDADILRASLSKKSDDRSWYAQHAPPMHRGASDLYLKQLSLLPEVTQI